MKRWTEYYSTLIRLMTNVTPSQFLGAQLTQVVTLPKGNAKCHYMTSDLCKGKAIRIQTWRDPEGSRSLKLPDCKTVDP